jgi:membrane-associated phospholipid phosphatase
MAGRVPVAVVVLVALCIAHADVAPLPAQTTAALVNPARPGFWWLGGALIVMAAASDRAIERQSLRHRSATLDRFARVGNATGSGEYLLPALGVTYLTGRLTHHPRLAEATLNAAAAYAIGNVVAGLWKPVIGRHRPDTLGSPWRFHPLERSGAYHALPSAHVMHAFTLAGAVAEEAGRPWVTGAAYGAAALVAWSRIYEDEHWASDVASSAVIGAAIGHLSVRLLHARRAPKRTRFRVEPGANGVAMAFEW